MCHLIDAKMMFIAILDHTGICSHHPSIAEEDMESLRIGEELFGNALNRRRRSWVTLQDDTLTVGLLDCWIGVFDRK